MMDAELEAIKAQGLPTWYEKTGFKLDESYTNLRFEQERIVSWARSSNYPYLLVNAPTGIGKTLAGGVYASSYSGDYTYLVSTKQLQDQVHRDLGIPTLKGRDNFACLIGKKTHGFDITAARGKCTFGDWCNHSGEPAPNGDEPYDDVCGYYTQKHDSFRAKGRVSNYPMMLSMPELRYNTSTAVLDEAHRIEQAVINNASIKLNRGLCLIYKIRVPKSTTSIMDWAKWARSVSVKANGKYDFAAKQLRETLIKLGQMSRNPSNWIVDHRGTYTLFTPIFGAPFVLSNLLGHAPFRTEKLIEGNTGRNGIRRVMFMSATLLAPDLMEKTLGLPQGSYDYLDLDSPFPPANRPINYSPVMRMNLANSKTAADRAPMQKAIDHLIDYYLLSGRARGIVHAVSRRYRDQIKAESRWSSIITHDINVHAAMTAADKPSVLVSDNIVDGYDGKDELCRFVIIPKVMYPNLGDRHVKLRQQQDPRSYDYAAITSIIQAVGRGVRHDKDTAETWILDESWEGLYRRRHNWLPTSFLSSYFHGVPLP